MESMALNRLGAGPFQVIEILEPWYSCPANTSINAALADIEDDSLCACCGQKLSWRVLICNPNTAQHFIVGRTCASKAEKVEGIVLEGMYEKLQAQKERQRNREMGLARGLSAVLSDMVEGWGGHDLNAWRPVDESYDNCGCTDKAAFVEGAKQAIAILDKLFARTPRTLTSPTDEARFEVCTKLGVAKLSIIWDHRTNQPSAFVQDGDQESIQDTLKSLQTRAQAHKELLEAVDLSIAFIRSQGWTLERSEEHGGYYSINPKAPGKHHQSQAQIIALACHLNRMLPQDQKNPSISALVNKQFRF